MRIYPVRNDRRGLRRDTPVQNQIVPHGVRRADEELRTCQQDFVGEKPPPDSVVVRRTGLPPGKGLPLFRYYFFGRENNIDLRNNLQAAFLGGTHQGGKLSQHRKEMGCVGEAIAARRIAEVALPAQIGSKTFHFVRFAHPLATYVKRSSEGETSRQRSYRTTIRARWPTT